MPRRDWSCCCVEAPCDTEMRLMRLDKQVNQVRLPNLGLFPVKKKQNSQMRSADVRQILYSPAWVSGNDRPEDVPNFHWLDLVLDFTFGRFGSGRALIFVIPEVNPRCSWGELYAFVVTVGGDIISPVRRCTCALVATWVWIRMGPRMELISTWKWPRRLASLKPWHLNPSQ